MDCDYFPKYWNTNTPRQEIGWPCLNGTGEGAGKYKLYELSSQAPVKPNMEEGDCEFCPSHLGKLSTLPSSWSSQDIKDFLHSLLWFYPSQLCLYTKLQCSINIHVVEVLVPLINQCRRTGQVPKFAWLRLNWKPRRGPWAGRFCPSAGCIVLLWTDWCELSSCLSGLRHFVGGGKWDRRQREKSFRKGIQWWVLNSETHGRCADWCASRWQCWHLSTCRHGRGQCAPSSAG